MRRCGVIAAVAVSVCAQQPRVVYPAQQAAPQLGIPVVVQQVPQHVVVQSAAAQVPQQYAVVQQPQQLLVQPQQQLVQPQQLLVQPQQLQQQVLLQQQPQQLVLPQQLPVHPQQPQQLVLPQQPQVLPQQPQQQVHPQQLQQQQPQQQVLPQQPQQLLVHPQQQQQQPAAAGQPAAQPFQAQHRAGVPVPAAAGRGQPAQQLCPTISPTDAAQCASVTERCFRTIGREWVGRATAACTGAIPPHLWAHAAVADVLALSSDGLEGADFGDCGPVVVGAAPDSSREFCRSSVGAGCFIKAGKHELEQLSPDCVEGLPPEVFARVGDHQTKAIFKAKTGAGDRISQPQFAHMSAEGCRGIKMKSMDRAQCIKAARCWSVGQIKDVDVRDVSCWEQMDQQTFAAVTAHAKNFCDVPQSRIRAIDPSKFRGLGQDFCHKHAKCTLHAYKDIFTHCVPETPAPTPPEPEDPTDPPLPAGAAGAASAGAAPPDYTCCASADLAAKAACLAQVDVARIDFWETPCIHRMDPDDFVTVVTRMQDGALCAVTPVQWQTVVTPAQRAALSISLCVRNPCLGAEQAILFPQCASLTGVGNEHLKPQSLSSAAKAQLPRAAQSDSVGGSVLLAAAFGLPLLFVVRVALQHRRGVVSSSYDALA